MGSDVIVVGSANIDHNVRAYRLPEAGETVRGTSYSVAFGGKGANQAVAAARMGARTTFIARVGDDTDGESLRENLRANQVDISGVLVDSETETGSAHIVVSEQGENQIVIVPGANANLSRSDIEDHVAWFEAARLVMLQLEVPLDTVVHAARLARRSGVAVMLDPAPAMPLPDELCSLVDYLVPNEREAAETTGLEVTGEKAAYAALRALRERGVAHPIVKMGARGVVALVGDEAIHVPAFPVQVVDTTAAGDAFAGGLAAAILEGVPLEAALRLAVAAGSLACTKRGAIRSLPLRTDVEKLMSAGT